MSRSKRSGPLQNKHSKHFKINIIQKQKSRCLQVTILSQYLFIHMDNRYIDNL